MSRIAIRDIDLEDYLAWFEMVQDYDPDIGESANQTWDRMWQAGQCLFCKVITVDDEPVGFMQYTFHSFFFDFHSVCYLSDLYVRPAYRNRGLGRLLLDYLFDEAKRLKWGRVYWVTHRDNLDAQRLYNRYVSAYEFVRYHMDLPCPSLSAPSPT